MRQRVKWPRLFGSSIKNHIFFFFPPPLTFLLPLSFQWLPGFPSDRHPSSAVNPALINYAYANACSYCQDLHFHFPGFFFFPPPHHHHPTPFSGSSLLFLLCGGSRRKFFFYTVNSICIHLLTPHTDTFSLVCRCFVYFFLNAAQHQTTALPPMSELWLRLEVEDGVQHMVMEFLLSF